jgi:MFS family permease
MAEFRGSALSATTSRKSRRLSGSTDAFSLGVLARDRYDFRFPTQPLSMSESISPSLPWWRSLSRYHWFVFAMASLAWLFDCLDQQLFIMVRNSAMKALHPAGTDPTVLKAAGGLATMWFVIGWATGGLIFGAVGDRIGRAKTLAMTVLIYSVFTGLSAFAISPAMFDAFRFLTGLGVGGVFGLSVALVADSLPDSARPHALGLLQALSAVGNVMAGSIAIFVGWLETWKITPGSAWSKMFLIGALPAFLCVFIQLRLKEPEKWVNARKAGKLTGVRFGSYAALLGDPRWRRRAVVGMLLCIAGVVGLWGIGFFSPELVGDVLSRALKAENVPANEIPGRTMMWTGVNMIIQNTGAFAGMLIFTKYAARFGRKAVFAVGYVCAILATILFFRFFNERSDLWMSGVMGFFQLALFAGFAIYLPELFPISLRSTGTSFCYNVGRFIAASGPFTLGQLQAFLGEKAMAALPATANAAMKTEAKLQAFRDAACWMSIIFVVGLVALPFAPETKGKPLPEE